MTSQPEPGNRSGANKSRSPIRRRGLVHLFGELQRRRVCRVAAMYFVGMWDVFQVVNLISTRTGLPAWTLVFHYTDIDSLAISTEISREIVAALPVGISAAKAEGVRHKT